MSMESPWSPYRTAPRRLDDAAQRSELRELRAGYGPTYIFGNTFPLSDFSKRCTTGGPHQLFCRSPCRNESSRVINGIVHWSLADEHGHFALPLERGGKYRVTANLPVYFLQDGLDR